MWFLSKRHRPKWDPGEPSILRRVRAFILKDLIPSIIILIILGIMTCFVAERVYQAKTSHTVNMAEKNQLSPSDKVGSDRMLPENRRTIWPRTEGAN